MTSQSATGELNIAPMGPIVNEGMTELILRPFKTSTTYQNLKVTGQGVFHVTDDVLLLSRAAVGKITAPTRPADKVKGLVLTAACRYHEFLVESLDDQDERTRIVCRIVHTGRLRDFFGFNRAKHAVLEAAILATRLHMTGAAPALAEFDRLQVMIDKTGGDAERQAMNELRQYVSQWNESNVRQTLK